MHRFVVREALASFIAPRSLATAIVLAVGAVGCGGRVDLPTDIGDGGGLEDGGADAIGGDGGVTGDGGTIDDGAIGDGGTIDDGSIVVDAGGPDAAPATCDRLADALCGPSTDACCTKTGHVYDGPSCRSGVHAWCGYALDLAAGGKITFDASRVDACANVYEKAFTTCMVGWLDWAKSSVPCSHMFNGASPPGSACTSDLDCHAPDGASAYCDTASNRCRAYAVVGAGKPCNYYGSTIRYCDFGLYCDLAATTPVCKAAKKLGAACAGPDDISCGYEATCKGGKCQKGLPEGAACTGDLECASWSCDSGTCTSTRFPIASDAICSGGTSGSGGGSSGGGVPAGG